ncbi:DNA modification protein [Burkholderia phage BcepSauron]|uniref:DNA modification protein n=1 Tax=Burkholderia phage BcepSauron TaxID=2530033 RepID=A0A482MM09_9CAUD|nr:DNA modification protein [Burkholderia phage BcepSauron]QBQ74699.1 DNA modification protein [Burkholderia phage BcepSauron]
MSEYRACDQEWGTVRREVRDIENSGLPIYRLQLMDVEQFGDLYYEQQRAMLLLDDPVLRIDGNIIHIEEHKADWGPSFTWREFYARITHARPLSGGYLLVSLKISSRWIMDTELEAAQRNAEHEIKVYE